MIIFFNKKDLDITTYRGPKLAANFCEILIIDKNAKILDVGAGTGFVGEFLKDRGFTNCDGLEPAKGMLDQAKAKNVYANYLLEGIDRVKPCTPADGK